jgi:tetratricopeptide (TPR) repeat protein
MECPCEETLAQFVEGSSPAAQRVSIELHLESCDSCRRVVAIWARQARRAATPANESSTPEAGPDLRPGSLVGRFVILEQLGAGGMGIVYSAYDPQLTRRVALKLLQPNLDLELGPETARARLLREAQAMAALSHPNIVVVHDVQSLGDRVVIGMELVEGTTLKGWLVAAPRGWRDVVSVFLEAGRGLSAAHAAGIIHRDFKPTNVLIGLDDRARVTDFGLARRVTSPAAPTPKAMPAGIDAGSRAGLEEKLTQEGKLVGTPAYMAPEALQGRGCDAKSDQFSFCVALYEALCETRPFADATFEDFVRGKAEVRAWPMKRAIPAFIRSAVMKGLAYRPEDRFAGMEELLEALKKNPVRQRLRWLVATGLLITAAVGGAYRQRVAQRCEAGGERWRSVWSPSAQESAKAAMLAVGTPYAPEAWSKVAADLAEYGQAWIAGHRDACRAGAADGKPAARIVELRLGCLSDRLEQVRALAELLGKADSRVVENAVEAVGRLGPVNDCAAVMRLLLPSEPPPDPAVRAHIAAIRAELAKATVLSDGGRYEQAFAAVVPLVEEARALNYSALTAELLLLRGSIGDRASGEFCPETRKEGSEQGPSPLRLDSAAQTVDTLHEALNLALASHSYPLAARAANILMVAARRSSPDSESPHRLAELSRSIIAGLGGDDALEAERQANLVFVLAAEGRNKEAAEAGQASLRLIERARVSDARLNARVLLNIAGSFKTMSEFSQALVAENRAYDFIVEHLGASHPYAARALVDRAEVLAYIGQYEAAIDDARRAKEILEGADRARSLMMVGLLWVEGNALIGLDRNEEASARLQSALNLVYGDDGRSSPGAARAAPSLMAESYAAPVLGSLARATLRLGRPNESLSFAQRARASTVAAYGAEFPGLAVDEVDIAWALTALGRPAEAMPLFERAVSQLASGGETPQTRAYARFGLAHALDLTGRGGARAIALAKDSRELYQQVAQGSKRELAEVDA